MNSQSMAPRKGTKGIYHSHEHGDVEFVVDHVDGGLCFARYANDPEVTQSFIWRFKDGLNSLHDWPGKEIRECGEREISE